MAVVYLRCSCPV